MKRIISTILVCVLLLGCVLSLASCGKMLFGKYESKLTEDNKTVYDFSIGKVTRTDTIGIAGLTKDTVTEGKYKINEVAFMTGFSSPSYFATCFQKQFNLSPSEFIKNLGQ